MTKIALPALVLIIFGLFFFSVTSPPDEAADIAAAPSAEPIQQRADTAEVRAGAQPAACESRRGHSRRAEAESS